MQLRQIFEHKHYEAFAGLREACSDFLRESHLTPLFKNLPNAYDDVHKVKVRKRKQRSGFVEVFNEAFDDEFVELRQRAVFTNGASTLAEAQRDEEPFYVFPINGFKFLYSSEVTNSSDEYRTVFESIFQNLDPNAAEETFRDLLKFTYRSTNLHEGILSGAEIIIYNTPYYFAVRESAFPDYDKLLDLMQER
jgi:hypothetical protein